MMGPKLTSRSTLFETDSPMPFDASQMYLPRSSFFTWKIVRLAPLENNLKINLLIECNLGVRIYLYELPFENKSSCPSRDHIISGVGKPSALQKRVAAWPSATRTFCNSVISKICGALVTCRSTSFSITLPRSRLIFKYYFVSKIISKSNAMFLPGTYIFQNLKRSGYESVEIIIIWLNGNLMANETHIQAVRICRIIKRNLNPGVLKNRKVSKRKHRSILHPWNVYILWFYDGADERQWVTWILRLWWRNVGDRSVLCST